MFGKKKKDSSKKITITYRIAAGIPFYWQYKIKDPSIVEFVEAKHRSTTKKKNLCGAPYDTDYIFKGLKEGKTTITFELFSISENKVDRIEKYKVEVDKDLNIRLV